MIYVVKADDSVDTIADEFNISVETLVYDNQIVPPYRLAIGQALFIPSNVEETNPDKYEEYKRKVSINGYAYPFISPWVLNNTLPYLSEMSVFSYGFTPTGYLIAPIIDDQWMITESYKYNSKPILTLTPFGEDGRFNNRLISAIVNDLTAQENLINQLIYIMQEKGFLGVDIDFEYILASDRDAFTAFVQNVTNRMNELGFQVSVALAPKISDTQVGLLYEGKDYEALGNAANHVLLMTYEWGYTYGPPMAVAPINKVREVVEYAVTKISNEKIDLGIPNYGYDWALPFVKGVTKAKTIGNIEAVQIAITQGVDIKFDEIAKTPYFRYIEDGITHEVWFEDVRSMEAKFELINEFELRGAGYWQIMRFFRANWLLLSEKFQIIKI